jgi:hypothetical protein
MASKFRDAVAAGDAKEVEMNSYDGVVYGRTKTCIGTDQLGACHAVVIVSRKAAIVGHVAPRPPSSTYTYEDAGNDHVANFMDRLINYSWVYESLFPSDPNAWVICATFGGEVALPNQQEIIIAKLDDAGFQVDASRTYKVPFTASNPDRGSVFVDGRGDTIKVWVEEKLVYSVPKDATTATGSQPLTNAPPTATSVPVGAFMAPDGTYQPLQGYYVANDGRFYARAATSSQPQTNAPTTATSVPVGAFMAPDGTVHALPGYYVASDGHFYARAAASSQPQTNTPPTATSVPEGAFMAPDGTFHALPGYYFASDGRYYPSSSS